MSKENSEFSIEPQSRIPKEGTNRYHVFMAVKEGTPVWDTKAIAKKTGLSTRQVTIARANLRGDGCLPKPTPELTKLTYHTHAATVLPLVKEYREMGLSPREIQFAVELEKGRILSNNSVHSAIVYNTKVGNLRKLSIDEDRDIRKDNTLTLEEITGNVTAILELRKRLSENNLPHPTSRLEWKKRGIIFTLAGPSLETAKRLTCYLNIKNHKLSKYGISLEDIERHSNQIGETCTSVLAAISNEEANQRIERLNLLLNRIKRKISIMTPLNPLDDMGSE